VTDCDALLIGTFHMANPGRDMSNASVDDVLAERRQNELDEVADRLANFRPTKVLVEWPVGDTRLSDDYDAYGREGHTNVRSESHQLGFRVASRCGTTVAGIDLMDTFYEPSIEDLRAHPVQESYWKALLEAGDASARRTERLLASHTIGGVLAAINTPDERAATLAPYFDSLLPMAVAPNFSGPDMVGNWYRRNFRIISNLRSLAVDGDRLVVIYGAGHIPVFDHILRNTSGVRVADPLDYLLRS